MSDLSRAPEKIDPHLCNNGTLVSHLVKVEESWELANKFLRDPRALHNMINLIEFLTSLLDVQTNCVHLLSCHKPKYTISPEQMLQGQNPISSNSLVRRCCHAASYDASNNVCDNHPKLQLKNGNDMFCTDSCTQSSCKYKPRISNINDDNMQWQLEQKCTVASHRPPEPRRHEYETPQNIDTLDLFGTSQRPSCARLDESGPNTMQLKVPTACCGVRSICGSQSPEWPHVPPVPCHFTSGSTNGNEKKMKAVIHRKTNDKYRTATNEAGQITSTAQRSVKSECVHACSPYMTTRSQLRNPDSRVCSEEVLDARMGKVWDVYDGYADTSCRNSSATYSLRKVPLESLQCSSCLSAGEAANKRCGLIGDKCVFGISGMDEVTMVSEQLPSTNEDTADRYKRPRASPVGQTYGECEKPDFGSNKCHRIIEDDNVSQQSNCQGDGYRSRCYEAPAGRCNRVTEALTIIGDAATNDVGSYDAEGEVSSSIAGLESRFSNDIEEEGVRNGIFEGMDGSIGCDYMAPCYTSDAECDEHSNSMRNVRKHCRADELWDGLNCCAHYEDEEDDHTSDTDDGDCSPNADSDEIMEIADDSGAYPNHAYHIRTSNAERCNIKGSQSSRQTKSWGLFHPTAFELPNAGYEINVVHETTGSEVVQPCSGPIDHNTKLQNSSGDDASYDDSFETEEDKCMWCSIIGRPAVTWQCECSQSADQKCHETFEEKLIACDVEAFLAVSSYLSTFLNTYTCKRSGTTQSYPFSAHYFCTFISQNLGESGNPCSV